jgi:hypothetical protein
MSYAVGEAAILTLIQALGAYDGENATRADWRPLTRGKAQQYVVLRPGKWANEQLTVSSNVRAWRTVVECWRRYADDTRPITLEDDVETVTAQLEQYPTLNGAVLDSVVSGGGDMVERELSNGSLWAVWEVYVDWQEEHSVSYAE